MSNANDRSRPAKPPEVKFGPYAGGIGVAVWVNTVENENGRQQRRSITIAPRRYRDPKSGEWKDSGSFRPSDIPILLVSLNKVQTKDSREDRLYSRRGVSHNCRDGAFAIGSMEPKAPGNHSRRSVMRDGEQRKAPPRA